jgi:phosphoribosylamine--glycine ligase
MKVLVVGAGGREHALAWTLAADPSVSRVVCAPGNPGMAEVAEVCPVGVTAIDDIAALVRQEGIDLTVVGPEAPLALGLADRLEHDGSPVVGPRRAAARLETSKAFAKQFMARHQVPTAAYRVCRSADEALGALDELGLPAVLKADGLASGKGVVVAEDRASAEAAIAAAMVERRFGDAGEILVVEALLRGEEASCFYVCDGATALPLGAAQDHKRVLDGDRGPNTGGMGAFAPSPLVTPEVSARVMAEIVEPVLAGMDAEGTPYRGFLYVGLMLTADGPTVIEFNVRFGDPEAQVVLPAITVALAPVLAAAAAGRLGGATCRLSPDPRVGVVLAAGGYPGPFERGRPISGLSDASSRDGVLVFHAGTARRGTEIVTDGGRVLTVVGRGQDHRRAMDRAYEAAACIHFDGMQYRRDIGLKALR